MPSLQSISPLIIAAALRLASIIWYRAGKAIYTIDIETTGKYTINASVITLAAAQYVSTDCYVHPTIQDTMTRNKIYIVLYLVAMQY
jgi:hypothetical protein